MKKALLVALLATMLVLVFTLCVSATGFVSSFTTDVTEIGTGPDWADLSDKNATAVLKKADETYVRIPLYYIYQANNSTQLRHEIQTTTGRTGFRYDWISEQLEETFTHANLVALDIPEGIKTTSGLNTYSALKEVVFPLTATGFPKSEKHPALEKVFAKQSREADGTVKGITTVSDYAFKNAYALAYFKLELDYVTYIGSNAFMGVAVKELRFEGPFTGMGGSAFSSCPNLETVYINNTSGNVFVCDQGFKGAKMLKEVTMNGISINHYTFENVNALTDGGLVVVATNVGDIGEMAFKNTTNLSSVTLSGVTSLGSSAFLNCTNLKTADISGPITTVSGNTFSNCTKIESAIIRVIGNPFPDATSVGGITSIVSKDVYENNKDDYETGSHFVYGYNLCELLYNGVHAETEDILYTYIDENGNPNGVKFLSTLKISSPCGRNCGSETIIKTIAPLFTCLGYSAPENGDGGITMGFSVNKKAVVEYEETMGKTLTYGVFAVSQEKLGDNAIFGENGATAGVLSADVTKHGFNMFEIKVVGFTDAQKDNSLAMGAYVAESDGEATTYSYMQDDEKGEKIGDYFFVSYNIVVGAPSSN